MEYCPYGNLQKYIESKREKFIDQINPSTGKFDDCYPPDIDNLLQKMDRYRHIDKIKYLIFQYFLAVMLIRFATQTLSSRVPSQQMEISNHWLQKTWSRITKIWPSWQGADVTPDQLWGLQTQIISAQFHPQKWQKRLTIIRALMVIKRKTLLFLLKFRIVKTNFRYSQGK